MTLEIECKYCDVDHGAVRALLSRQGGVYAGTFFERNRIYETEPPSLRERGKLLRLRSNFPKNGSGLGPTCVLTFKGPVTSAPSSAIKIRVEEETVVKDNAAMRAILMGLGYVARAGYEKVREVWHFNAAEIALDTLPFGSFMEIEAEEAAFVALEESLGLGNVRKTNASYHSLHQSFLELNGLPYEKSFFFSQEIRKKLLSELGIDDPEAEEDLLS